MFEIRRTQLRVYPIGRWVSHAVASVSEDNLGVAYIVHALIGEQSRAHPPSRRGHVAHAERAAARGTARGAGFFRLFVFFGYFCFSSGFFWLFRFLIYIYMYTNFVYTRIQTFYMCVYKIYIHVYKCCIRRYAYFLYIKIYTCVLYIYIYIYTLYTFV